MTLSAKYEALREELSKELERLPEWKRDALRRDEEFVLQRNREISLPARGHKVSAI